MAISFFGVLFESSVNLYDGQTYPFQIFIGGRFESSVNLYDDQTFALVIIFIRGFESSVNLYDGQIKILLSTAVLYQPLCCLPLFYS